MTFVFGWTYLKGLYFETLYLHVDVEFIHFAWKILTI